MIRWSAPALAAVVVLMLAFAAAPAAKAGSAVAPVGREPGPAEPYRIGAEDTLYISVWKNDSLSRTVPVRPDGMVSLPLVNDIRAAGLTPMELRDQLATKLAEYMPNPEVSVILTDVHSFKVSVIGEVTRPARYELKGRTTVLDVLALAGGFTQFAARQKIVVLRTSGKTVTRIPFNYNRAVTADQENFDVQPGDIVLVP